MRYLVLTLMVFNPGFGQMVFSEDQPTTQSATQNVKAWIQAFTENDADGLLKFYEDSADVTVVVSSGQRYQGHKELGDIYRKQFEEAQFFESTSKNLSAKVAENSAIVHFEHLLKFRLPEDDSKWQVHIRTTIVLQLKNGKWKIIGEHSSPMNGVDRISKIDD